MTEWRHGIIIYTIYGLRLSISRNRAGNGRAIAPGKLARYRRAMAGLQSDNMEKPGKARKSAVFSQSLGLFWNKRRTEKWNKARTACNLIARTDT